MSLQLDWKDSGFHAASSTVFRGNNNELGQPPFAFENALVGKKVELSLSATNVFNGRKYRGMRIESGVPKFPGSQDLPDFPYSRYAELLGFIGIRVERPEDLAAAWDTALSADRPVLLDIANGDPDEAGGIVESVKSMVAAVLPTQHADPPG